MKKRVLLIFLVLIIIAGGFLFYRKNTIVKRENNKKIQETNKQQKEKNKIENHYSNFVKTNKEAKLYKKDENKYTEYGKINSDVIVSLDEQIIDANTKYFKLLNSNLYIFYNNVNPCEEKKSNTRYKNYIPFNENIKTENTTEFYDLNDNYLYTINEPYDFQILVNDNNRYGVEFNDELLFIHQDNIIEKYNTDNNSTNKNKIKVLTYHFLYNSETSSCTESICQSLDLFESHLKYIRENDYFTLKLDELEMYLDGKINIPEKSIVLTIDDGTIFDLGAIELLEKYQSNATLFVVTSWIDTSNLNSEYLDLESHSDNMHNQYECPGYGMQGGGILCLPEEQVLNDLKTSQEKLGGSNYFAYPFFDFNARSIELLKKAGFHMAFIGQYDTDGYSYPKSTDKFKVRRKTIFNDISMDEFISYLK